MQNDSQAQQSSINNATQQSNGEKEPTTNVTETTNLPSPTFDEIVELISTGQADRIPGIKQIPMQINKEPPSESTMPRPAKPWETANRRQAE